MIIDSTSPTSRIETTISVLALSRFILVLVSIYNRESQQSYEDRAQSTATSPHQHST